VSSKTMSTNCPHCNRPIIVEDITVKSYMPVNDLQTCGNIKITKRGRVAAKNIQAGDAIECEGTIEGAVEATGAITLGPKASWKGPFLHCPTLTINEGAQLNGPVTVPWE